MQYICITIKNKYMKAKQIHLDDATIEILTIDAIKNKSTFKVHVQAILTEHATKVINNKIKTI